MRSLSLAAVLLLRGLCSGAALEKRKFTSPSDPSRFTFYPTPSKGVICDGDSGPDGLTMWYQDLVGATMGQFNFKTTKFEEYTIPYSTGTHGTPPFVGNVTALQCVVRTGKDGMVYGGGGTRNEIVQVNPRTSPPTLQIFSPTPDNPAGNLLNFNDAWAANQGLFFSSTTGNVVSQFNYLTHDFIQYKAKTPASGPLGMRTDKHNNLWFTNFFGQYISVINNVTGEVTPYETCCPLPGGAFPEVLRSSTQNQKYLWANAFGANGYIRIEPDAPDADKFKIFTNPTGLATFPFENSNDFCGRIWYTSPTFDILVYYTPKTKQWTTVNVPAPKGLPGAGNFEVIMHRGPGHYMWFSIGTLGYLVRYELDASCVGEPQ